jgi:hypothetical protein
MLCKKRKWKKKEQSVALLTDWDIHRRFNSNQHSGYVKFWGFLDELLVFQKGLSSMESADILNAYSDSYIC